MTAPFGGGAFIADTSAWHRARHPQIEAEWRAALENGQIVGSPVVAAELLYSARSAAEFDDIREEVEALRTVELSRSITTAGLNALRALVDGDQHRRVSFRDVLIAASAESRGLGVLHYDQHFDLLAGVLNFESRWIAPRGAL